MDEFFLTQKLITLYARQLDIHKIYGYSIKYMTGPEAPPAPPLAEQLIKPVQVVTAEGEVHDFGLGPTTDLEAIRQQQETAGLAFLRLHGAEHLGSREITIEHDGGLRTGTIAAALGGGCTGFREFAESMIEVGGSKLLAPTIEKHVEKSEQKALDAKKKLTQQLKI